MEMIPELRHQKHLLKQFTKIGAYSRVAVLTRGLELYIERRQNRHKEELAPVIGLFWQFCAGSHDGDQWDERMGTWLYAYRVVDFEPPEAYIMILNDEILTSIIIEIDMIIAICTQYSLSKAMENTDIFESFSEVLNLLGDQGIKLGDLTPLIAFDAKVRSRLNYILGGISYYLGRPLTREAAIPLIDYHLAA